MLTPHMIEELREDPTLVAIYTGTMVGTVDLPPLYDIDFDNDIMAPDLKMEPGDEVLITEHTEGKFIHFMSLQRKRYHYRSPWPTEGQVEQNEGALFHV